MTIKEIENRTAMTRANVRFYEREGLIVPERGENNYRDYSEEDLQTLLRVKLLRSLHIPLEDIKALRAGKAKLTEILLRQIGALDERISDASYAREMCRVIREEYPSFETIDAQRYLDGISRATSSGTTYFTVKSDTLPQVTGPWRRYLARMLDLFIYEVVWWLILTGFFGVLLITRISSSGLLITLLDSTMALVLMWIFEPLLLHFFGTTPGKAVFGLRIESPNGGHLTYGESLWRLGSLFYHGMGYGVPLVNVYCMYKCYKIARDGEIQEWDHLAAYISRDNKWRRGLYWLGVNALVVFALALILCAQSFPPNRGELTVAQFAENLNYYQRYYDPHGALFIHLDSNGEWREAPGTISLDSILLGEYPRYQFTTRDGYVTGVSFEVRLEHYTGFVSNYDFYVYAASLAFVGAQRELGLFSNFHGIIMENTREHSFESFEYELAGVELRSVVEYEGLLYYGSEHLYPQDDFGSFYQSFTITKGAPQ